MLTLLLSWSALAQVTLDAGNVLSAATGTFYARGVGAPSVVWDPSANSYVMAFETQVGDPDASCPEGRWAIGLATSPDGYDWDVWSSAVVSPTAGTAWSCYAAQPSILREEDGTFHLFFKAGQDIGACNGAAWGCAAQPGVGKVSGIIDIVDTVAEDTAALEARLDEIPGEIDALLADLGAAVQDFLDLDLETTTALQCVDYPDVCSPCPSITFNLAAPINATTTSTVTLCQPFDFALPNAIVLTSGNSRPGDFAYIRHGVDAAAATCTYKGVNTSLHYTQDVAQGQCAPATGTTFVQVEISKPKATYVINTTLTATNAQSWQGPGYTAMADFAADASALDATNVEAGATNVLTVLDGLADLVAPTPQSAAEADLSAAIADITAYIEAALADLDALQAEEIAIEAELEALQTWTPTVDLDRSQDGPSLLKTRAGYPTVTKVGSTWHMQVQFGRNLFSATSTDGETFTQVGVAAALVYSTIAWSPTELTSPALTCGDDAFAPDRHHTYVTGRQTSNNVPGGPVVAGSLGDSISGDFTSWLTSATTLATWNGDLAWRHFDVLNSGSGLRVWVSEKDASGKSVIRHGSSGSISSTGGSGKVCE